MASDSVPLSEPPSILLPDGPKTGVMISDPPKRNFADEYRAYIDKMTRLAGLAGLNGARASNHPIFRHLLELQGQLNSVISPQGLRLGPFPNDPKAIIAMIEPKIRAMSAYGNDRMYWLADGYFGELISDAGSRRFIESRLSRPELFHAVIAELQQWGYLKARGLNPKLVQDEGLPDLKFGESEPNGPYYFDVKSIGPNGTIRGIKRHIEKSNAQIKRVKADACGGCFLRLITPVNGGFGPDEIPHGVATHLEEIDRLLRSNYYKSVSKVVLTWEEISFVGNIPGWLTWCVTRKSITRSHLNPRVVFDIAKDYAFKSTCAMNIRIGDVNASPIWDVRTERGNITITPFSRNKSV